MAAGQGIRRAAYPAPGSYTLSAEGNSDLNITIESASRNQILTGSHTRLYEGQLSSASFTVPADSEVVYFNISASQDTVLESLHYVGNENSGKVPLDYKLLPD